MKSNVFKRATAWLTGTDPDGRFFSFTVAEGASAVPEDFSDIPMIDMEHHYYAQAFLDIAAEREEAPIYYPETNEYEYVKGVLMNLTPVNPKLLDLGDGRVA